MSAIPTAIRRLCLAVDVVGYSKRARLEQIDVQNRLLWTMVQGCRAAGISPARCDRQDSGDGQILILPAAVDEARVIPNIVLGLLTALRRVNHPVGPGGRIRLRISMGQGAIQVGATGFVAPAVVTMCRLLDSDELRDALTAKPASEAVLIVTADLYQDVVGQGYGGLPAQGFSRIVISKPGKGFSAEAWIQVPEPQPLLATVPAYPETDELGRKQRASTGGLLSLGAAATLAWAAFVGSSRTDQVSGLSADHHGTDRHVSGTHAGDHDPGHDDATSPSVTGSELAGDGTLDHATPGQVGTVAHQFALDVGEPGHVTAVDDPGYGYGGTDNGYGYTGPGESAGYGWIDDAPGYGGIHDAPGHDAISDPPLDGIDHGTY